MILDSGLLFWATLYILPSPFVLLLSHKISPSHGGWKAESPGEIDALAVICIVPLLLLLWPIYTSVIFALYIVNRYQMFKMLIMSKCDRDCFASFCVVLLTLHYEWIDVAMFFFSSYIYVAIIVCMCV